MTHLHRQGLTLIEIMLVVLCIGILMGPIIQVFRHGTQSSLQGMLQIDTTLEARRVIRQISQDLKNSCFRMDGTEREFNLGTVLHDSGTPPTSGYTFLSFSQYGQIEDSVPYKSPGAGNAVWRRPSEITYRMIAQNTLEKPFFKLMREERFHPDHPMAKKHPGGIFSRVLSDRVNYFHIQPHLFQSANKILPAFIITLQLVDSLKKNTLPIAPTGNQIVNKPRGWLLADFYEVVTPEFLNSMLNRSWFNPNWQTMIGTP
jgi:type II secretory pathway pseudopilin PulG